MAGRNVNSGLKNEEKKGKQGGGENTKKVNEWTDKHARARAAFWLVACPHAKELTP
jgi:hypothetical protein